MRDAWATLSRPAAGHKIRGDNVRRVRVCGVARRCEESGAHRGVVSFRAVFKNYNTLF